MCASEYGADRVAQIITFGKLQARAAVRDVGRVLGLPFGQVNKVAELIPNNPAASGHLAAGDRRRAAAAAAARRGRRHRAPAGDRAAARGPVSPRQHPRRRRGDRRPAADRAGAAVPRSAVRLPGHAVLDEARRAGGTGQVRLPRPDHADHPAARRGPAARARHRVDLDRLPLDDAKTYEMLQRGDAGGVFQMEGQGMRDVLRQMRPDRFEDLIAAVALYRPGPMASIPDYCRRKHGEAWEAPHPAIHDILAETYGIIVYQEQVMQIAQKMARLLAGRRRSAAPRDGQEDPRGDGGAARDLHQGRDRHAASSRRRPPKSST